MACQCRVCLSALHVSVESDLVQFLKLSSLLRTACECQGMYRLQPEQDLHSLSCPLAASTRRINSPSVQSRSSPCLVFRFCKLSSTVSPILSAGTFSCLTCRKIRTSASSHVGVALGQLQTYIACLASMAPRSALSLSISNSSVLPMPACASSSEPNDCIAL